MKTKIIYLIILLTASVTVLAVGISIGKNANVPTKDTTTTQILEEKFVPKEEVSQNDIKKEVNKIVPEKENITVKESLVKQTASGIEPVSVNKISDKEVEKALECIKVKQRMSSLSQQWDKLLFQQNSMLQNSKSEGYAFSPDQLKQIDNSVYAIFAQQFLDLRYQSNYLKAIYWQCF